MNNKKNDDKDKCQDCGRIHGAYEPSDEAEAKEFEAKAVNAMRLASDTALSTLFMSIILTHVKHIEAFSKEELSEHQEEDDVCRICQTSEIMHKIIETFGKKGEPGQKSDEPEGASSLDKPMVVVIGLKRVKQSEMN